MALAVKIISIEHLTHDVLKIVAEKPNNIAYNPGQAVDVSINKAGWEKELRPFTFTSLPEEDQIEFNIKTYTSHKGVTNELLSLKPGDELLIGDVFGDIAYKGEGIFIAGGAGITPFIAILKHLQKSQQVGNSKLIFANKTKADIIDEGFFKKLLGSNFINVLSDEKTPGYEHGYITADVIKKQITGHDYFYLCGPPPMMDAVEKHLASLGITSDRIVKEAF
ncbi:MAG: flavodoxin reductase [Bacteroidetes bacterium]|nr:flavodoxin reductase [Bacteroidota bacterium]MBS1974831.1 flavodoxin reductase [Bacteroidota bacterium]